MWIDWDLKDTELLISAAHTNFEDHEIVSVEWWCTTLDFILGVIFKVISLNQLAKHKTALNIGISVICYFMSLVTFRMTLLTNK